MTGVRDILLAIMPLDLSPFDLLRWYVDAGADEAIGEIPADRFAVSAKPPPPPVAVAPPVRPPAASPTADLRFRHDGGTAAQVAAQCHDLAQLRQALESFDALPLKRTAMNTVFADGNPQADIMCIGEAPGPEEDRQGLPFVGKVGKLLDSMLASIGLDRTNTYITNVVPWRPVDSHKPSPDEVAVCLPFITRHIELVDPKLLILFGGAAASALLARHESINRLRGHWFDYSSPGLPRPVPVMATFHPSYLLGTPAAKREAWRDLLAVRRRLDGRS